MVASREDQPGSRLFPDALKQWKGCRGFFAPIEGNHGDRLIELGTREVFGRLQIDLLKEPTGADVIFLSGGGAWAEGFHNHAYGNLLQLANDYPRTPLVVLPSSVAPAQNKHTFLEELEERKAPLHFFLRESRSFEKLQQLTLPACVQLHLDYDMAFYLSGSEWLNRCQAKSENAQLLVVERLDLEQSTPGPFIVDLASRWAGVLGRKWLRRIIRAAHKGKVRNGRFLKEAISLYRSYHPGSRSLNLVYKDISHRRYSDFDGFVSHIVKADLIVTTRLHVAILGALLDKRVALKDRGGDYNKIEAVFTHSLKSFDKVQLTPGLTPSTLSEVADLARRRAEIFDR